MKPNTIHFHKNVDEALADHHLATALQRTTNLLSSRRSHALPAFAGYERARDQGRDLKDHVLAHLDYYLEQFEANATANGTQVHWASSAEEACATVVEICRNADAKLVTKSKSMLGEEIGINEALEAAGLTRVETDLGEHIIQLADEPPSHIVMPAMHKTQEEVRTLFARHHRGDLGRGDSSPPDVAALVQSARREMREAYFKADVGISGANFLIAESGGAVTVTNEGNAELTTALPRVHIVTVGIEKVVPTFHDATLLLRLLARSALGTELTQYTTFYHGPKGAGDRDGPEEMHVVLVDNQRSAMLNSDLEEMLRCIRCGACMNVCPVYGTIGGHAYGWVYPGPMGAILTPALNSLKETKDLPHACTLNGACSDVCPVRIPLTDLLRRLRARQWREGVTDWRTRWGIGMWGMMARRPGLYQRLSRWGIKALGLLARGRQRLTWLPGAQGWTRHRDVAAPAGKTFQQLWAEGQRSPKGQGRVEP